MRLEHGGHYFAPKLVVTAQGSGYGVCETDCLRSQIYGRGHSGHCSHVPAKEMGVSRAAGRALPAPRAHTLRAPAAAACPTTAVRPSPASGNPRRPQPHGHSLGRVPAQRAAPAPAIGCAFGSRPHAAPLRRAAPLSPRLTGPRTASGCPQGRGARRAAPGAEPLAGRLGIGRGGQGAGPAPEKTARAQPDCSPSPEPEPEPEPLLVRVAAQPRSRAFFFFFTGDPSGRVLPPAPAQPSSGPAPQVASRVVQPRPERRCASFRTCAPSPSTPPRAAPPPPPPTAAWGWPAAAWSRSPWWGPAAWARPVSSSPRARTPPSLGLDVDGLAGGCV